MSIEKSILKIMLNHPGIDFTVTDLLSHLNVDKTPRSLHIHQLTVRRLRENGKIISTGNYGRETLYCIALELESGDAQNYSQVPPP